VTVTGRPEARTWQAKDGTERTAVELAADVVAVGLARGPVTLDRRSAEHADQPPRDQPPRDQPRATSHAEHVDRPARNRLDRWQDDAPPF
jgi:single-stranded DNA-binding protein